MVATIGKAVVSAKIDGAIALVDHCHSWCCDCGTDSTQDVKGLAIGGSDTLTGVKAAVVGTDVVKVGRVTGRTAGKVMTVDGTANILNTDGITRRFTGQIFVQGTDKRFSEEGDSGAVIVNPRREIIGLLFAGEDPRDMPGKPPGALLTFVNHIEDVLTELDVFFPSTTKQASLQTSVSTATGETPGLLEEFSSRLGGTAPGRELLERFKLSLGRRWLKLVARSSVQHQRDVSAAYVTRYPIALPSATDPRVAHPDVWAGMQAVAGRRMDGYLLYQHIKGGGHASDGISGLRGKDRDTLDALGPRLTGWFDQLIDQPTDNGAWDPHRLEHRISVNTATTGGERVLTANEYRGGSLDWHAFSQGTGTLGNPGTAPAALNRTVFPAPVRFSGMPLSRWWAIEDGRTNFAAVTPDSTDLARLIFLEFALVYSNDWYLLPCDVPAGTFASVQGLAVTDVFGERRWITPTDAGLDGQSWSMFRLGGGVLLPPGTPKVATGPALEDVALVRDESANLVWGIEQTVRQATGEGRPGTEAAAETLAFRRRQHSAEPPDDPRAPFAYQAMTSVPENWIPFIPVHVPGDNRNVRLQRAAMPSEVDATAVHPRTALLREGLDAGQSYFINEEEVPRTGTRLTVAYNRTRTVTGRPVVWLTVHRDTGRGERSSGLAFDVLKPVSP
jgi:hypothetical protein